MNSNEQRRLELNFEILEIFKILKIVIVQMWWSNFNHHLKGQFYFLSKLWSHSRHKWIWYTLVTNINDLNIILKKKNLIFFHNLDYQDNDQIFKIFFDWILITLHTSCRSQWPKNCFNKKKSSKKNYLKKTTKMWQLNYHCHFDDQDFFLSMS